jgi:hypothetical protein
VRGARALPLALIALLGSPASARIVPDRQAFVFLVDGLSYRDALADPVVGALARAGGIGLMTNATETAAAAERTILDRLEQEGVMVVDLGPAAGEAVRTGIEETLAGADALDVLAVVAVVRPSEEMAERTGRLTPIVVASGEPGGLLSSGGHPGGLTSDTTRRDGVVSNVDVAPTVLDFLGTPIPDDGLGAPIRVGGRAPTELVDRYVQWRRSAAPVGLGVLAFALASLAVSLVLLLGPWRATSSVERVVALWVLLSVAVLVALVPASLLPDLRPLVVVVGVAVIGAFLASAALLAGRGSPTRPVALLAAAGLVLVVLDAALGWPTGTTPLLGGSALEGVRFFGLGNPYSGIVLSGAVLTAALLRPWTGVTLLAAAAFFAGLPFLGADLGGAITLSAVAAVWYGLRVRGRLGWREWALVGAAAVAGAALVVVTHLSLPPGATHVSRTVGGSGPVDLLRVVLHRLALNLRATTAVPAAWLAVLGVPFWLALAWRRPGRFRVLDRDPAWRDAVVVLAVGAMIGYVLNDTYGLTAVAFVFLSGAVAIPVLWSTNA